MVLLFISSFVCIAAVEGLYSTVYLVVLINVNLSKKESLLHQYIPQSNHT